MAGDQYNIKYAKAVGPGAKVIEAAPVEVRQDPVTADRTALADAGVTRGLKWSGSLLVTLFAVAVGGAGLAALLVYDWGPSVSRTSSADIVRYKTATLAQGRADAQSSRAPVPNPAKLPSGKSMADLKPGLNVFEAIGAEAGKFTLWKEGNDLTHFEMPYKTSHAVVVAIDDYDRSGIGCSGQPTGLRALSFMKDNARELAQALRGLGFDEVHELFDCDATREKIDRLMRQYWKGGVHEHVDRLFFYFGGHGVSYRDMTGDMKVALATFDYEEKRPNLTSLLADELRFVHSNNVNAKHFMMALDVCHAGLMTLKQGDADQPSNRRLRQLRTVRAEIEQNARNLLLAGTDKQEALWLNGGVFTR